MTNFLTRRTGRQSAPVPTQATRSEAFANAVAAFRQATDKAEARVVPCRCAVTAEPFLIVRASEPGAPVPDRPDQTVRSGWQRKQNQWRRV
jgi:hypothetical protein